jgi:diaminohydroxyphosphoribosylaminopyrimidine deaminase/5-amino-6-(5-phosphoribosylamino)uracil reductase
MSGSDERFMARALQLALSAPFTSPNPRVGAVVVAAGRIVGEGAHRGRGTPHAEMVALANAGSPPGATVYVTLEPCSHHGRTPPCAPALVRAGVRRVVVALVDPDPRVSGRGIAALRAAGVDVTVGVGARAAALANAPYLHQRSTGRSYLSLKLAQSMDGRTAAADGSSRWITGPGARRRVHERRARADAVMVGAGTVLVDDPQLTARSVGAARQPARVVVDGAGRVPSSARVFASEGRVLVATTESCPHDVQVGWKEAGAEVVTLPPAPEGVALPALLERLGAEGFLEVVCEGGARLATSLLRDDLVDRVELHLGPVLLGGAGGALGDLGVATMGDSARWRTTRVERVGDDVVWELHRSGA